VELQRILVRLQFHLQGLNKSGMPCDMPGFRLCLFHCGHFKARNIVCLLLALDERRAQTTPKVNLERLGVLRRVVANSAFLYYIKKDHA
jgi:hypothetical protein